LFVEYSRSLFIFYLTCCGRYADKITLVSEGNGKHAEKFKVCYHMCILHTKVNQK